MKKKRTFIGLILLVAFVILSVPSVVSILMEWSWMDIGTQKAESWMSFWGGYLGAILGIIGAITATSLQIKSQTNQIVVAAKENDRLERIRIELNLIIEKNIELFKFFLELEKEIIKYNHAMKYLVSEQINLPEELERIGILDENFTNSRYEYQEDKMERDRTLIQTLNHDFNEHTNKIQTLKNELNHHIAVMKSLSSSISANLIFISKEEEYFLSLKSYVNVFDNEVKDTENYMLLNEIDDLNEKEVTSRINELNHSITKLKSLGDDCKLKYSDFMDRLIKRIESQNK